jgi:hypothetical protein
MAVLLSGCIGFQTDRPPDHKMIEMAFFTCEKCRSLEGGIYGKGPFKSYHTTEAGKCIHQWQEITMDEFKALATQRVAIDWSREIPFWRSEGTGKEPEQSAPPVSGTRGTPSAYAPAAPRIPER